MSFHFMHRNSRTFCFSEKIAFPKKITDFLNLPANNSVKGQTGGFTTVDISLAIKCTDSSTTTWIEVSLNKDEK
jgi:hypothetical protein